MKTMEEEGTKIMNIPANRVKKIIAEAMDQLKSVSEGLHDDGMEVYSEEITEIIDGLKRGIHIIEFTIEKSA